MVQHFPVNLWQTQCSKQSFDIFQNHFRTKYDVPFLYLCRVGVYESQLFWHCLCVCTYTAIYIRQEYMDLNYFDNMDFEIRVEDGEFECLWIKCWVTAAQITKSV